MSKKIKNNHKIKYLEIIKNNNIKISNQKTKIGEINNIKLILGVILIFFNKIY